MTTISQTKPESIHWKQRLSRIVIWLLVILFLFIAIYPFAWAFITSFKGQREALEGTLIPWAQFTPTLENWQTEFGIGGSETFKGLRNSVIIAGGATLMATTIGTLAGYGLARFKYGKNNSNWVSWFLSQRFLPPVATVIPFVILYTNLRLIDTHVGMILVNATFTLSFATLIMRDFFADFPVEIEEAALVDGATEFQLFWRIALPLAGPALAASIIICFAFSWNEFLFASVLTNRNAAPYTQLVSGSGTVRGIMFGFVSTRLLIAILIPVILSLFVQRYVVRGLTFGAVKG
jgi:multiple sugar transport system permease protein